MSDERVDLNLLGARVLTLTSEVRDLQQRFGSMESRLTAMESRFSAIASGLAGAAVFGAGRADVIAAVAGGADRRAAGREGRMKLIAKTERTDQGEQFILPGAERSARQAVAARGEKMRSKKLQLPPGGMFEAPEPEEPCLF